MRKLALLLLLFFLNRNRDSSGLVVMQNRHALKNITFISSQISYWREIQAQVLPSPKQRPSGQQQGCSRAATEEADGETHGSGLQAWHRKAVPIAPGPCLGWKQGSLQTWTVHIPHMWQKHLYFLQPGPWEASDTAHELWFVCLGHNLFLTVVRDYRQEELWVLVLNFGRVG